MSDAGAEVDESGAGTARSLTDPETGAAVDFLVEALESGRLATIFGHCVVDYEGRAASDLGPGERHVMIKPDGTTLVHSDEGQQPVNWMPPRADVSIGRSEREPLDWQPPGGERDCRFADDGALVVESRRTAPEESLVVRFSSVAHAAAFAVDGGAAAPEVVGTEADLKERVLAEPDLVEPGFAPLATERETPAGAVDVYGEDSEGRTVVLELKRRRVGPDAVGQLHRYVEALERDLHADAEVRGVLVAPSVTERAEALLAEKGLEFVSLTPRGDS